MSGAGERGVAIEPHPVRPERFARFRGHRTFFEEDVDWEGLVVEG